MVISDYGQCLKMVEDLKLYAGKFKQCFKNNKEKENDLSHQRIKIKKKNKCCGDVRRYDAEEYYKS